jgi:hypothetical protein
MTVRNDVLEDNFLELLTNSNRVRRTPASSAQWSSTFGASNVTRQRICALLSMFA